MDTTLPSTSEVEELKVFGRYDIIITMLLTPHTFIGLVIAHFTGNPILTAPLAFLSHFIADKIPHWDFYSNTDNDDGSRTKGWRMFAFVLDFGLALSIGWFFFYKALYNPNLGFYPGLNLIVGALFSNLPDAMEAPYIFHMKIYKRLKFLQQFTEIQKRCQTQTVPIIGISLQLFLCAVCALLLLS